MSDPTHRPVAPYPDGHATPRLTMAEVGGRLLDGAVAAGLGLGMCAVLVLTLWISSPYPELGLNGALHVAAGLWLLAHGAGLQRTGALAGEALPVELTPLMLAALPAVLLYRATRLALVGETQRTAAGAVRVAAGVGAGYLLVGAAATCYASAGSLRVDPLAAALRLPLATLVVVGFAVWLALGRPVPALTGAVRTTAVLRAAGVATAVLLGGGALLAVVAVCRRAGAAMTALEQLSGTWSGHVAVVLLSLALLPNAAVWAASYGLGTGFTLGGGSAVGAFATTAHPWLPPFPLLVALPPEGPGTLLTRATCVVPVAAGLAMGRYVAHIAAPVAAPVPRGGSREETLDARSTVVTAALAALLCGGVLAVLAALAGGALGTGALAEFGPSWWLTGTATLAWTAVVGTPTALAVRAWRLRERRPARDTSAAEGGPRARFRAALRSRPRSRSGRAEEARRAGVDDWHATAARRSRWAALTAASKHGLTAGTEGPRRD